MRLICLHYLVLLAVFAHAAPTSMGGAVRVAQAAVRFKSSIAAGNKVWVRPKDAVPKPDVRTQKSQLNLLFHHPLFLEYCVETSRNSNSPPRGSAEW